MRHQSTYPNEVSSSGDSVMPRGPLTGRQLVLAGLFVLSGLLNSAWAATKPNVILVMTDDNDQLSWEIGGNCCEFL
jgi:hypothetical protein